MKDLYKETAYYQSPVGPLEIVATDEHLLSLHFKEKPGNSTKANLIIKECFKQLDAYFSGQLREFSIPYNLTGTEFQNKVWSALTKIPFGKTISYQELAIRLGDIKCIRAAGTANGRNNIPIIIPCHRVIGKDGSLVGFGGGLHRKKWLLTHEGIIRGEQIEIFA